ncbi:MAG: MFS transporter [Oligoflexia bacterium]|nr:MFS transporter [Oligoflexia bacterium]
MIINTLLKKLKKKRLPTLQTLQINWNTNELGKDFWIFRFGQIISIIGDNCSYVALMWWILDKTGSAAKISTVLAPSLFIKIFLLPLCGPLGDFFPRKWIVVCADCWRAILTIILAVIFYLDFFYLPLIMLISILIAVGSALFESVSISIIPNIISDESKIPKAVEQTQSIITFGAVIGGISGGVIVTFLGIGGAFIVDAISFIVAMIATLKIKSTCQGRNANEGVKRSISNSNSNSLSLIMMIKKWFADLLEGIYVIRKIPLEFGIGLVAAILNLVTSPLVVALPVLVKEARNMPPWFLGALEASVGVGGIVGAILVGKMLKKIHADYAILMGIIAIGIGISVLPRTPNLLLPLLMMFFIGMGAMITNVPIITKSTMALPDQYRSRVGSCASFLYQMANPIGVAFSGYLISTFSLNTTLLVSGGLVIILSPLIYRIPDFKKFMRLPDDSVATFYIKNYPEAFKQKLKQF